MAPIGSADSLRELLDLVERHPGHKRIHPRLKPWLSAVGIKKVCKKFTDGIVGIFFEYEQLFEKKIIFINKAGGYNSP